MNRIEHFINGQVIDIPRDWQGLELSVDYETEKEDLDSQTIEFTGDASEYLRGVIQQGISGGVGVFEGVPFTIKITNDGDELAYDGYLDLADENTYLGSSSLVTKFKKKKGEDWLNDVADGFSFEYLHNKGILTEYINITYAVNWKIDGIQLATLGVSIFILTKTLIEQIEAISKAIMDIIETIPLPAPPTVALPVGKIITNIINVILQIALAILMVIAIIKMINAVIEGLAPQKGIHKGVRVYELFKAACNHLGLEFQSTLIAESNPLSILPIKMEDELENDKGYPTSLDGIGTFGELIRVFKKYFDADFRLSNGVFIFERLEYFELAGTFLLPSIFNDQGNVQDNYKLNTNDFSANFVINFQFDAVDENTLDNSERISYQVTYEPIVVNNDEFKLMKGLTEIGLPFALGTQKGEESFIEQVLAIMGGIAQLALLGFGTNHSFQDLLVDTTGALLLSKPYTGKAKILNIENGVIVEPITAESLWQYHSYNSFIGDNPNQWYLYDDIIIPLTLNQFLYLSDNPYGVNEIGEKIRIDKLSWNPASNLAKASFRVRRKYTNNLKIS